jgi:RHS repeat-associated protein
VVASYAYDPFGNTMSLAGSYSDQNPWRFSTKWWESETELLAFQFRHFSSSLGRWINLDPTWEEAFKCMVVNHLALRNSVKLRVPDVMPYAFVKNDPINRIDYYGLQTGLIQGLDITITTENGSYFTGYTATDITTSGEITACKDEDLYITVKNDPYDVKKMAEENGPIAMAGVDTESGRAYPTVTNYTDQPDVKGDRLWDTVNNPSSFAKTPITDIQVNVAKGKWKPGGKANVVIRWKDSTERWTREISIK